MTRGELETLQAVAQIGTDGWPVSVREVRDFRGLASTQTAHATLTHLERQGLLATTPRGRKNGWRLAPPGRAALGL